jgi:hypothetical protein
VPEQPRDMARCKNHLIFIFHPADLEEPRPRTRDVLTGLCQISYWCGKRPPLFNIVAKSETILLSMVVTD